MRFLSPRTRALALLPLSLLCAFGCATDDDARSDKATAESAFAAPAGTVRDAGLEEAAALLCVRDTSAVLDDDARRGGRVWEGQVAATLERVDEAAPGELERRLSERADALVAESGATHYGFARGQTPSGQDCAAVVVTRRQLRLQSALPGHLAKPAPFPLSFALKEGKTRAKVFLLTPLGSVERTELDVAAQKDHSVTTVIEPRAGNGRYVLEIIAAGDDDAPEVALLWPFTVGSGQLPPSPDVLFPDEGHPDIALTRRLEALVHRLRIEQQQKPLSISTPLGRLSKARAEALSGEGRLGHRLPDDKSALEALRQSEPGFPVNELAEVQAQAGTLDEAWTALLDSPAHRYEIVGTRASHVGAAVVRGQDGLGRPLVSVVLLLARRILVRPISEVRTELIGRLNLARDVSGSAPLKRDAGLEKVASDLAEAMAKSGSLDEGALGKPVSEVALEGNAKLEEARAVIARVDDPLRISPSGVTLDSSATLIGVGLVSPVDAGQWYVALVLGVPR